MPLDALAPLQRFFQPGDLAFAERVWATPQAVYLDRLRAVGLDGRGRVLGAGCGDGQWFITPEALRAEAEAIGFKVLGAGVDGSIDLAGASPEAFFEGEYHGQMGVHEILLERL